MGCLASFLLASLALLGSILGEAPRRSARLRGLRVLGASRGVQVRTQLWATAFPLTILGMVAAGVGLVVCLALRSFDERATVPWRAAGISVLGATVVALALAVLTLRSSLRATTPSGGVEG